MKKKTSVARSFFPTVTPNNWAAVEAARKKEQKFFKPKRLTEHLFSKIRSIAL